jgi:Flp pilus assembly pilin Flp
MLNANDLLRAILVSLGQISAKLDRIYAPSTMEKGKEKGKETEKSKLSEEESAAISGNGIAGLNNVSKKEVDNMKNTAEGLKTLGEALKELSSGLWKFKLAPGKKDLIDFMRDIVGLSQENVKGSTKEVAESIAILSTALPQLAKGVMFFGLMSMTGLVLATVGGLTALHGVMISIGADPLALAGAEALGKVGTVLLGLGSVFKSMAILMISFAASILIFLGATILASKVFNVGPFESIMIILGLIGTFALGFAMLGALSVPIMLGATAAAFMGIGLTSLSIGLLAFVGVSKLMDMMGASIDSMHQLIMTVGLLALIFSGLGILSPLIMLGSYAAIGMGGSLLILSLGMLAFGGVSALLGMMMPGGIFTTMAEVAKSLGLLALIFAGMGILSIPIIAGAWAAIAISGSLIVLALTVMLINKILGEIDISTIKENISDMVSSVLIGTASGIQRGLLGEDGDSKGFFGKIFNIGKNALTLMAGIGLVFYTALTLSMLGRAISAFAQAGTIRVITGYKENGDPIFGEAIPTTNIAKTIATTISEFFNILTTSMKPADEGGTLPDKKAMGDMVDILMGTSGFKIKGALGIPLFSAGKQRVGVIEVLGKFGDLLSMWGKFGQKGEIPQFDSDGKPIAGIPLSAVASNIMGALNTFFSALNNELTVNVGPNIVATSQAITDVLVGRKRTVGQWIGDLVLDRPSSKKVGILEPLMNFSELIQMFASGTYTTVDANGKTISKPINYPEVAKSIVGSISTFISELNIGFVGLDKKTAGNIDDWAEILLGGKKKKGVFTIFDKFHDLILKFANNFIMDPNTRNDEKPKWIQVDYTKAAQDMVGMISTFLTTVSSEFTRVQALSGGKITMIDVMDRVNTQLERLIKQKDGLDKTAKTIGIFADRIKELAGAVDKIDTSKLESISKLESSLKIELNKEEGGWYPGNLKIEAIKSETTPTESYTPPAPTNYTPWPATPAPMPQGASTVTLSKEDLESIGLAVGDAVTEGLKNAILLFSFTGEDGNILKGNLDIS